MLDGRCSLGILAPLPVEFPSLTSESVGQATLVTVVAPNHPLASFRRRNPKAALAKHVQLVLTGRSELSAGRDYGVKSASTWRLADLSTKHAFLKDCIGWGNMSMHMVQGDLANGTLVSLDVEDVLPAGRWLVDDLKARFAHDSTANV